MIVSQTSARWDRRGLLLAVAGCAVASAVLLVTSGLVWLEVALPAQPPLPGVRDSLTGAQVVDSIVAIAILVGAAGLALVAARRFGRLVVGVALVAAGLLEIGAIGFYLFDHGVLEAAHWAQNYSAVGESPFPDRDLSPLPAVLALFGSGITLAVGLFAMVRSGRWPVMGARYERRTGPAAGRRPSIVSTVDSAATADAPAAVDESAMWSALERGEDPTRTSLDSRLYGAAKPPDESVAGR